ncbi:MAG: hypothetical protein E7672_06765 [Ruminococcaceae bacterium]|nr:hypothetical protein [Oscillospiraceae bacterium]
MRKDIVLGKLPNPFVFRDGSEVRSIADWERRRYEILEDVISLEFDGLVPEPEKLRFEPLHDIVRGKTISFRIHCGTEAHPFSFCFMAYIPKREGRMPVVLTGDAVYTYACTDRVIEEADRRGFVIVKFNRNELAPDYDDPDRKYGINAVWKDLKFSAISAWAWGYRRVIDVLCQLDFVDTEHIAITGHSRGGKTVLLAGATDERVRYTSPNGSGTHGCGCYRFLQREEKGLYEDDISEPLDFLFEYVPYWMGQGLRRYIGNEQNIPHDSHYLKALIAPRCFLETNGYGDIWANPRGSYLSWRAAREVWKMYGAQDKCCTWYRDGGHDHGWKEYNALFDLMESDINGTPIPDSLTKIPYDDMDDIYEWSAPEIK